MEPRQEVGEVSRIEGKQDVRICSTCTGGDIHHPDGVGVPSASDAAHVILGGVEVVSRGYGYA